MNEPRSTVLVVDDDPDILRLVVTILRRLELTVLQAGGAEEALRVFESLPAPPDLLLTDVIMPHVSGPELAKKVQESAPEIRVLFMSGFENRLIAVGSEIPLLLKPFTFENLGKKVMEVLQSAPHVRRIA